MKRGDKKLADLLQQIKYISELPDKTSHPDLRVWRKKEQIEKQLTMADQTASDLSTLSPPTSQEKRAMEQMERRLSRLQRKPSVMISTTISDGAQNQEGFPSQLTAGDTAVIRPPTPPRKVRKQTTKSNPSNSGAQDSAPSVKIVEPPFSVQPDVPSATNGYNKDVPSKYPPNDIRNPACVEHLFSKSLNALRHSDFQRSYYADVPEACEDLRIEVRGFKVEIQKKPKGDKFYKTIAYSQVPVATQKEMREQGQSDDRWWLDPEDFGKETSNKKVFDGYYVAKGVNDIGLPMRINPENFTYPKPVGKKTDGNIATVFVKPKRSRKEEGQAAD